MLEKIYLSHFKCFKKKAIRLGPITVFIGANGAGKSSAGQALLLLKQSINQAELVTDGSLISLGPFKGMVNTAFQGTWATIGIEGSYPLGKRRRATVDFSYNATFSKDGQLDSHKVKLVSRHAPISAKIQGTWNRDGEGSKITPSEYKGEGASIGFSLTDRVGKPITDSGGGFGSTEESETHYKYLQHFFPRFLSTINNVLDNIYFVPGMRCIDSPVIALHDGPVKDFVSVSGPSGQAQYLASTLGYIPEITDKISPWTDRLVGGTVRQKMVPKKQQSIEIQKGKRSTNIVNEGFGLNQSIFLFSQLAHSPENSTVIIEEPELHLHPSAQSKLVDILVDVSQKEKKQLLLITHSEHILFRLLTRVAQGVLKPTDLVVNYFEKKDTGVNVKELKVDKQGGLKGGMPGFFEEGIKEFKDYIDAISKKGQP